MPFAVFVLYARYSEKFNASPLYRVVVTQSREVALIDSRLFRLGFSSTSIAGTKRHRCFSLLGEAQIASAHDNRIFPSESQCHYI